VLNKLSTAAAAKASRRKSKLANANNINPLLSTFFVY
jgi:hypothetical protein